MNKDKKIRIIASSYYLINALKAYEERPNPEMKYDHDFELHLPGHVLTVIDGALEITTILDEGIEENVQELA